MSRARVARPLAWLLTLKLGEWLRDRARDESDLESSPGRIGLFYSVCRLKARESRPVPGGTAGWCNFRLASGGRVLLFRPF
jgi:hypothetical protein